MSTLDEKKLDKYRKEWQAAEVAKRRILNSKRASLSDYDKISAEEKKLKNKFFSQLKKVQKQDERKEKGFKSRRVKRKSKSRVKRAKSSIFNVLKKG